MKPRMGTFFILAGLALMILFVVSILTGDTSPIYLFFSFVALLLGFLLRRTKPVIESGRFGVFRNAKARKLQKREDKKNNLQKK